MTKAISLFLLFFFACGTVDNHKLKVAATAVPHAEMLEEIKSDLKKQDINLDIIVIDDYNVPNRYVNNGEIDANFFQHLPFLEEQKEEFGYKLKSIAKIHIEPMGIYSKKYRSLSALPQNATIALPGDPTNEARALLLLEKEGVITIDPNIHLKATVANITNNPKHLKFLEVDAPMLPRTLNDVDAAIIPSNFALAASLDPLAKESVDSPYANILVIREGEEKRPDLQALKKALTSDKMRTFILSKYKGAIIPAF